MVLSTWRKNAMPQLITIPRMAALAGVLLILGGCSSEAVTNSSTDVPHNDQPELSAAGRDQLLQRIGRGLAMSLNDPAVRTWVQQEMASSPYVEYRIPIRDKVLNESGRAEVKAIGRAAGLAAVDIAQLRKVPQLELYMPIEEQRANWHGSADVQVAVRRPTEDYMLYETNGSKRIVGEKYMPSTPTLVLAVSEIDYADHDAGWRGGRNTGDAMMVPTGMVQPETKPSFSLFTPDPSQWTRSFSQYIIRQHDGGIAGDDEMEIFGNVNNGFTECRRYTGLKHDVQYFRNINGNIGIAEAVALAVPGLFTNDLLNVDAWEDDAAPCGRDSSDDFYGSRSYSRTGYNVQVILCFGGTEGDAKLGFTEYVNGQNDFNSPSSVSNSSQSC
jgi:hypothetical protein